MQHTYRVNPTTWVFPQDDRQVPGTTALLFLSRTQAPEDRTVVVLQCAYPIRARDAEDASLVDPAQAYVGVFTITCN